MTVAIRTAFQGLLTAAFLLQLSSFEPLRSLGQETKPLQHAWEVDPDFGDVWGSKLEVRAKYIELEDLRSDQAQLRLEAAQAICTNFDRKGFQDKSKALDLLIEQLDNPQNTTLIRRSILSAACLLDDGSHAATIWKQAEQDPASRGIAERYLAKWKSPIAKDLWRKRLSDSKVAQSDLVLALDGLAQVGEEQDATAIIATLKSNRSTNATRLAAAQAIGKLKTTGSLPLANEVIQSGIQDKDLIAAFLLAEHTDPDALKSLEKILAEGSGPAQRLAANRIAVSYPDKAIAFAKGWAEHPDKAIRLLALGLLQLEKTESNVMVQGKLLSDLDLTVRTKAREQLLELAQGELRPNVDSCVTEQLDSERWQGVEQAIILAVQLQDRSRCKKLISLLDHPRPDVNIHAGWGLMELADEPEILAAMVPHAEKLTAQLEPASTVLPKHDIIRLSFLFEAFGRNRYEPSLGMLYKYIPKDNFKMGNLSRASAIWAIGKMKADVDDPELRVRFQERITDLPPMNPENYLVRYACIVALGRFGYRDSKEIAGRHVHEDRNPLGYASKWAIEQIDRMGK